MSTESSRFELLCEPEKLPEPHSSRNLEKPSDKRIWNRITSVQTTKACQKDMPRKQIKTVPYCKMSGR